MKVKKYISFRDNDNPALISYLREHGIEYDSGEIISSLEIYEHDIHWEYIGRYVQENRLLCLSESVFSKKELSGAEWLTVRSKWRNGYPQPEGSFEYERITYSNQACCVECGIGLSQVSPFRMKKSPKWGNKHFMMLNWIPDELFVDEKVKNTFQQYNISGISFDEVLDKKGIKALDQVYQMTITNTLPPGILKMGQSIDVILECPSCSRPKYHPTGLGMHSFKREIFDNASDIIRSFEMFGWGHSASRLIIVNQRTYQVIIQNKLDGNLVFEPVLLI